MSFTVAYSILAKDNFTAVADKIRQSIDRLERSAKSLNDVQAKAATVSAAHATKVKKQGDAVKNLGYQTKLGAVESKMLSDKFRKNANSLSVLNALTLKNASATKLATQKQKAMKQAIRESDRAAQQANRQMRNSIAVMRDVGTKANQVGNFMLTRVALPLAGIGALAYKSSKEFNKGMANVGTLIPGQSEKLKRYKGELQEMMVEFGQSGGIMTEGLYQIISSVGDTTDSMDKLKIATKAAVAGNAATADSVNLLTGVSADYGDTSAAMMQKVSDLAFKTVELGVTTFPELAQQMGRTTTQAKMFGVSVEELFGSYAGLTSGTVRTDMVSTRLAGVFAALGKRAGPIVDVMKRIGVASGKELVARFGGLQGALFALRREVGGNEIAFSKLFEDQRGRLGALALTGAKAKETAKEIAAMKNSADSTTKAFKEQTDGIGKSGFKAEQTKAKFERLSQEWGDKLIPIADKLMDRADQIINWLSKLDDETISSAIEIGIMAAKFALVSKAIGGVLSISGGLAKVATDIGGLSSQMATAGGSATRLAGVMGKGGPLAAALLGGVAVGLEASNQWNQSMDLILTRAQNISSRIGLMVDKMKDEELQVALKSEKKKQEEQDSLWTGARALLTGRFGEREEARKASRQAQIDILEEQFKRLKEGNEAVKKYKTMSKPAEGEMSFSSNEVEKFNAVSKRKDEIVIKFEGKNGEKITEIKHERDSGSKKFALGSNL